MPGNLGSIPRLGRSPGGGNGNPFQYSCLENFMDRGVWQVIVHGIAELDMTEWLTYTQQIRALYNISRIKILKLDHLYFYTFPELFLKYKLKLGNCVIKINCFLLISSENSLILKYYE